MQNVVEAQNGEKEKEENGGGDDQGEQVAAGWPPWLTTVCGEALSRWIPQKAYTFEKIDMICQGTYSNVYKAKDTLTAELDASLGIKFTEPQVRPGFP
ncbi:hypothetical protein JHK85_004754 [Glycine max]|nr:hypothetical protein JHK85_004754 [Glycine max]